MFKATASLRFGENHAGKPQANGIPGKTFSKMANTKVSMRSGGSSSGGRNVLQIQGRPRSLDSGYPPPAASDFNAKPRPFYTAQGGDNSNNHGVHSVMPLTQPQSHQGGAPYQKSPRPFRKAEEGLQAPRATSYPSYPTQKKMQDLGRNYLPDKKNLQRQGSSGSTSMLGSDLSLHGIRERSSEKSPGRDVYQSSRSPLARELSTGSPKLPWSPGGREASPVRPQPPRSPRKRETSPSSPKVPWCPPGRNTRDRSPAKEPLWCKVSPNLEIREISPVKDPPWGKPQDTSAKERAGYTSGRDASPAKENRPPWSAGAREYRDPSPVKDPRPPWSAGVRDMSPKERQLATGKGRSPGKEQRPGQEASPRGRRPQWPSDPREPSPSKERSPGGRGQSPKERSQWSPAGRGTSPGKEQRPPWSPGGRGTSPSKDVRPPWMVQTQVREQGRVDNRPRSRGSSPTKEPRPPWAQQRDRSPGLDVPVSHPPPRSPRTRGQSPAKQEPHWAYPGGRPASPKEQKKRSQSARDQSPAHLPPAGQGSPRMSRSQRSRDPHERTRKSPQRVSPKRSPPAMSYSRLHEEQSAPERRLSPQRPVYSLPPERASYEIQEEAPPTVARQYSRQDARQDDVPQVDRGRHRVRSKKHPPKPARERGDGSQLEESYADDSMSEQDDEVKRIMSGILDTTSPSRRDRKPAFPPQEQRKGQGQGEGHAFEPYGRQDSSDMADTRPQQPHSHFYESLQLPPLQDGNQGSKSNVPSVQNTAPLAPPRASAPKKVLIKSMSVPIQDPTSFTSNDNQVAPSSPEEQQSPQTRREAFARSKTVQTEVTSDLEMSEVAVTEHKQRLEKLAQASAKNLSTDSGHEVTAYQSEGEMSKVPKSYKTGPTVTFINGLPCEVSAAAPKKPPRHVRQEQMLRTQSLDAEVYREKARGLESASELDDAGQSDSRLSGYAKSRSVQQESAPVERDESLNRYSGTYDNVAPPSDRTDNLYDATAPSGAVDELDADMERERVGNPAVFLDVQNYGDTQDYYGPQESFSLLQPPEEDLRKSPSVREMAAERELAEATHLEELRTDHHRFRKTKAYSSRKMSMPVESHVEKMRVRKMSLEGAMGDMTSGSDTDERSRRATPMQAQGQDAMAFKMRPCKFRHVFGEAYKKDKCYENIRITKNQHDSMFCAVNPKFMAVVVESSGGGAFMVLPVKQTGRIDINAPKVCGHAGAVLDIKWSPFNDHQIASCSDDATIKVWEIPEDGLHENLTEWIVDLHGHQRRIGYIEWHPTAEHILLSAGFDYNVILWNIETAEPINIITCHTDTIYSLSWNRDGSLFATTSKDKKIRVIDPRSGCVISEGSGHVGPKSSKIVFLGDSMRLFTTGFSRMSERQFGIWDANDLSKPLRLESIDSSSGVLLPYYDIDNRVMFLVGKGDGNIRYYEIVNEAPYCHFLNAYLSGQPQKGFGVMPKRGVDLTRCEIVRFFKLLSSKPLVEPISMRVPRKSEMFQEDIFPPTASSIPSLSAMEWINGQNREPILVSLKDGAMLPTNTPTITTYKAVSRSLLNNNDTQPHTQDTQELDNVPASVRNIKKLSISGDQIPNLDELLDGKVAYEDDPKRKRESVHERISAFETKVEPIRPSPPPMLSNTVRQVSVEKKPPPPSHWTNELPPNGLPKTDGEADTSSILEEITDPLNSEKKVHVKKVWTPKSPQAEEPSPPIENGITPKTDPELRKAYFRQLEEIHSLKEQITLKDKRIRQLEEEMALLKNMDSDDERPNESNC